MYELECPIWGPRRCEEACQDGDWGVGVAQALSQTAIEDVIMHQMGETIRCGWRL